MRDHYFRVEHSQRPTITELQDKILQHALRDLGIEHEAVGPSQVIETAKKPSVLAVSIHRWAKMHMAEKNL